MTTKSKVTKLKSMRLQVLQFTLGGLAMVALGAGVSTGSVALAAPTPAAGAGHGQRRHAGQARHAGCTTCGGRPTRRV